MYIRSFLLLAYTISVVSGGSLRFGSHIHKSDFSEDKSQPFKNQYESAEHWISQAQADLDRMEASPFIEAQAKNVIIFLGDGVSAPTVTASRILKGQKVDNLPWGEEAQLHIDTFPIAGASKTFCSDVQVADSACSGTALFSGTKANFGTLGVSTDVSLGNCTAQGDPSNHISSILAWAHAQGKATGIVTTTRVTHASPAATYAHSADRHWENDGEVRADGGDPSVCTDIAHQLIRNQPGSSMNVILGGGRRQFLPSSVNDPESGEEGLRQDGVDLIEEWKRNNQGGAYVTGRAELANIPTTTEFLLGLFAPSHLGYRDEIDGLDDPSLEGMVEAAIKVLQRVSTTSGFVLIVEGGRIDHGHHETTPQRALWEMIELDKAVKKGDDMTDDEDTLIIVTSDHASVMHFAGYPGRGGNVLGRGGNANDNLPYNVLGYANGPGIHWFDPSTNARYDISQDDFDNVAYRPPSPVPMHSETHGGEDVPIYAKGPFAHLLSGVNDQSFIPHVAAYAACIGDGVKFCDNQ